MQQEPFAVKMTFIVLALSAAIVAIPAFFPQAPQPAAQLHQPATGAFTSCQVNGVDYRVDNEDLICASTASSIKHSNGSQSESSVK